MLDKPPAQVRRRLRMPRFPEDFVVRVTCPVETKLFKLDWCSLTSASLVLFVVVKESSFA